MTATQSTFEVLAAACRCNSGSHFLDSGCAYGRWHESPPIPDSQPIATLDVWTDSNGVAHLDGATLETEHYLAAQCNHLPKLQRAFTRWEKRQSGDWFALGREFMERRGYVQESRDNVCNSENDLTQVYVWEVWTPEDSDHSDWLYADDAVFVVYIHTGCDVRGGYSYPVFLKSTGDYACPIDLQCEYRIIEARGLDDDECREIDDSWTCGYSGWPAGELRKAVKRWFPWTLAADRTSICAILNSGHAVKIGVSAPL